LPARSQTEVNGEAKVSSLILQTSSEEKAASNAYAFQRQFTDEDSKESKSLGIRELSLQLGNLDEESLAPKKQVRIRAASTVVKSLLVSSYLNLLLPLVPLGIFAPLLEWNDTVVFTLNFLAIIPLAKLLGYCTEDLAASLGGTLGSLINASFGNIVEMLLSIFALREGLVDVVQGSLLGSIYSNLLLVLGFSFFCGGLFFHSQKYNADGAVIQTNLLLLALLAMIIPSLVTMSTGESEQALSLSRYTALVLSVLYSFFLTFQLGTHPDFFSGDDEADDEEHMPPCMAAVLLFIITMLVAASSRLLVGTVEGITLRFGVSKHFIGVVLLPIVGNAAEHITAVSVAVKDNMDLALGIALGSSLQIALLVVPFTVEAGWIIGVPMDLNFRPVGSGILLLTVLIIGRLTSTGTSNWLEGLVLIAAYVMIALTFWVF
jgi:Ca2+:H+ antiporter